MCVRDLGTGDGPWLGQPGAGQPIYLWPWEDACWCYYYLLVLQEKLEIQQYGFNMKSHNFYVGHNFYKHTGLQTEHTQGLNSVFVALPVYNLYIHLCSLCFSLNILEYIPSLSSPRPPSSVFPWWCVPILCSLTTIG